MGTDVVEMVREANDIVEVISERVRLKKQGKNYVGLCPFHQEKTPSFTVSPEKQLFYCFGCQAGGDVFKFVELWENTDFKEALAILAGRAGIPLADFEENPRERQRREERELLYQVLKLAARYYHYTLLHSSPGKEAREYCSRRALGEDVIRKFGLGYALPGWDNLLRFFVKRGYSPEVLVKAGLVLPGKERGHYDRFRHRIIFPIWDNRGRVVAFGGRVLDDSQPKYLNSPETSVYTKGKNLYGLHLARTAIRDEGWALVVEGYLDAITVCQFGWPNVVASLGTALTRDQAQLLARYARRVLIAYDADTAGQEATLRGFRLLREAGCQVLVVPLPEGSDPDSYLRQEGKEAFSQLLAGALPLVEYRLQVLQRQHDLTSLEGKLAVVNSLVPLLLETEHPVEREVLVKKIAGVLAVSEESIWAEIRRFRKQRRERGQERDRIFTNRYNIDQSFHNQVKSAGAKPAYLQAQVALLGLCLVDNQARAQIIRELAWEQFAEGTYRDLAKAIWEAYRDRPDFTPAELMVRVENPETRTLLSSLSFKDEFWGDQKEKSMRDCLAVVKRHQLQKEINALQRQIISLEREGKSAERENLLIKLNDLLSQIRRLC